jgi:cation diffusion facilitator CzcD-associated flavoprotein CzcO
MVDADTNAAEFDAVVIGGGFSGLYMLHRLRDVLGLRVRLYEAGSGVGGTWYWNRYPGARCDSEGYVYCYSFSEELLQDHTWASRYPEQPEILDYLGHVADRFELRSDIQLDTRVTSCRFRDRDNRWEIETDRGERVSAQFLVSAVGLLASVTHVPDLPGLESFRGDWYHTGRWPHEQIDFSGKKVGVIGTGSTGVQAIPVIAKEADELYVFQRSPQFTVPARNHRLDRAYVDDVKANYAEIWDKARWSAGGFPWQHNGVSALDVTPREREALFESLWEEGGFKFVFGSYRDILTDERANRYAADFIRSKIRERVDDPGTAEKLTPYDHPFGGRRPIIDSNYYETYNRDNVTLVSLRDSPIEEITPTGIKTTDAEYELDVIVFATGFDAVTGPFFKMDIVGKRGKPLTEKWADGPQTYLGVATAGFPNMFMITGPGSTFGNLPVSIEHHVEWIANCIEHMRKSDIDVVEARADAENAWMEHVRAVADRTVAANTDSWWTGGNIPGKPRAVLFFLGSYGNYRQLCEDIAADDYRGFDAQVAGTG